MADAVLVIGSDFLADSFTAGCSCGWEDEGGHASGVEVVEAWDNHCEVVFIEATGDYASFSDDDVPL